MQEIAKYFIIKVLGFEIIRIPVLNGINAFGIFSGLCVRSYEFR